MHRLRLSSLLVGVNVGLLLLVVAGVAIVALQLLQQLADELALARVKQAGIIAQQKVDSTGQAMLISANLLSERPTLSRLLEQQDSAALDPFILQFQQTSRIDATAVIRDDRVLAHTGAEIPWEALWREQARAGTTFLHRSASNRYLILGAWASVPTIGNSAVGVALRLDEAVERQLSSEISLPVTITEWNSSPPNSAEPAAPIRARAVQMNDIVTARLANPAVYLAVVPLVAPSGEIVGVIETRLDADTINRSLRQFAGTLLLLALLLATLTGAVSLFLGRRLVRPLRSLTSAAARIGRGDLESPVAVLPGPDVGQLAGTLEEMRRRLLSLTEHLRRQQAEAQAIVAGIIEGVFSVDRDRRIRYLNPQAAAMLGITAEAATGRFCGDVLRPHGANGVRPCEEQCPIVHARFRGGARATEHLIDGRGNRHTVIITSAPPNDDMQVQIMRDETEIEATRRLRDAILANISHEFRTPLSAQLASIELLLDQLPELSIEQIQELVLAQQRGTLRLTQLIDNLLESARIEAGQDSIRRQPVALDEVVEEALELTRPLLQQRKQAVAVELPYPLPLVRGDARRLIQVFVNLLGNANKFAPSGSTIEIGGSVDETGLAVWVADQGPGLPTENGQELFKRFVRSSQEEPEQSGVGLGLWLVKSIVERHGGHVEAQSLPNGTRMCVIFPLEQIHENLDRR